MTENECFICYSKSGKTIQEKMLDNIHHERLSYPLITLSHAYNCHCGTMWAHNRCLMGIYKCPSCRKYVYKPNLCVTTNVDKYLNLKWIKKYQSNFKYIQQFIAFTMIAIIGVILIIDKLNKVKNIYILSLLTIPLLFGSVILHISEYAEKYWLYNDKTKSFY